MGLPDQNVQEMHPPPVYSNFSNYQIQRTLLRGIAWRRRSPWMSWWTMLRRLVRNGPDRRRPRIPPVVSFYGGALPATPGYRSPVWRLERESLTLSHLPIAWPRYTLLP